jgi:hypothetical protein
MYPNWDLWFENKPSGNPVAQVLEVNGFDDGQFGSHNCEAVRSECCASL